MLVEWLITQQVRRACARAMRLEPVEGRDGVAAPAASEASALYVHVPFCEALCPFCPFHRVRFQARAAARYFDALRREIGLYADAGHRFSAVYVGGGTPTVVPDELAETLRVIRERFGVVEICVETNPNHLRDDVFAVLTQAGVNRLSVGVQTFDDAQLGDMKRLEPYGSGAFIRERLAAAKGVFDTLNADMIFNTPLQTDATLEEDLRILTEELALDQLSFYPLMSGAPDAEPWSGRRGRVSRRREKRFFGIIRDAVRARYRPSSAWCFSRSSDMIDEYIVRHEDYVGAGSGAFGLVGGVLHANTFSLEEYAQRVGSGLTSAVASRRLLRHERMRYDLLTQLFGLRLDKAFMAARYGENFERELAKELLGFRLLGALSEDDESYRLNEAGLYYWVVMMRVFFESVNRMRAQMRGRGSPMAVPPHAARPGRSARGRNH